MFITNQKKNSDVLRLKFDLPILSYSNIQKLF